MSPAGELEKLAFCQPELELEKLNIFAERDLEKSK